MANLLALKEERAALVARMHAIVNEAKKQERSTLNTEEESEWNKLDTEQEELASKIAFEERAEKTDVLKLDLEAIHKPVVGISTAKRDFDPTKAFAAWALYGSDQGSPASYMEHAHRAGINLASPQLNYRSLDKTSNANMIEAEPMVDFDRVLKYFGPMAQIAKIWRTSTGNNLPYPKFDDTANSASLVAEAGTIADNVDPTIGANVTFSSYKLASGTLVLSQEVLRDNAFNLEDIVRVALEERIGRKVNSFATTGTGSSQPKGAVTASILGYDNAHAAFDAITVLTELEASIDPAYLSQDCVYMMHQTTLKRFKQAVDQDGRPLWRDGLSGFSELGTPTLNGYRYYINNDMAQWADDAKAILFFNPQKFVLRFVGDLVWYRLTELYAATNQIGIGCLAWMDSNAINTSAVRHLKV